MEPAPDLWRSYGDFSCRNYRDLPRFLSINEYGQGYIGDHDLVAKILRAGYVVRRMRRYLAAFTMTGSNMSNGENARMERARALEMAPAWVRWLRWPLNLSRFVEKAMSGAYYQRAPLAYAVYDSFDSSKRTNFQSSDFTFRWVSD